MLNAVATNVNTYSWTLNGSSVGSSASYQVVQGSYGTYTVEITDNNTCRNTASFVVSEDPCEPIIPNIITPNGDTHNEYFEILNLETHKGNNLKIFNRWGVKVYESDNYQNNWRGEDLPDGTYYYILTVPDINKEYKGTITKIAQAKK